MHISYQIDRSLKEFWMLTNWQVTSHPGTQLDSYFFHLSFFWKKKQKVSIYMIWLAVNREVEKFYCSRLVNVWCPGSQDWWMVYPGPVKIRLYIWASKVIQTIPKSEGIVQKKKKTMVLSVNPMCLFVDLFVDRTQSKVIMGLRRPLGIVIFHVIFSSKTRSTWLYIHILKHVIHHVLRKSINEAVTWIPDDQCWRKRSSKHIKNRVAAESWLADCAY